MNRHDKSLAMELQQCGFNGNDVWIILRSSKIELPDAIKKHTEINADVLSMFLDLARYRKKVRYSNNEIQQNEINNLFEMREKFYEWNPYIVETTDKKSCPIKTIKIKLESGENVVMSNKLLLDNFYLSINAQLRYFIDTYVVKNHKTVVKLKGAVKGLPAANKVLAQKMLVYLDIKHPAMADKTKAVVIHDIFKAAQNKLVQKDPSNFIKKLRLKSSKK